MLCVEDENRSYHVCKSSFGRGLFVKSPRAPFCNTSCGRKNRFLAVENEPPSRLYMFDCRVNLGSSAREEQVIDNNFASPPFSSGVYLLFINWFLDVKAFLKAPIQIPYVNADTFPSSINSLFTFHKTRQPRAMKQNS